MRLTVDFHYKGSCCTILVLLNCFHLLSSGSYLMSCILQFCFLLFLIFLTCLGDMHCVSIGNMLLLGVEPFKFGGEQNIKNVS